MTFLDDFDGKGEGPHLYLLQICKFSEIQFPSMKHQVGLFFFKLLRLQFNIFSESWYTADDNTQFWLNDPVLRKIQLGLMIHSLELQL